MTNNDQQRDLDLLALADGGEQLTPERRAELERAIAESSELAAQYEATRKVAAFVDQLPSTEPSPGFAGSLERKLDAIDHRQRTPWWSRWSEVLAPSSAESGFHWRWATAAGAVAVAVAWALWAGMGSMPSSDPDASGSVAALAHLELLEVAEHLELLEDFDVVEQLDVLEDLEVIESLELGEPG